jgi:tetratricopeptide (TPR) repeat protein
MRLFNSISKQKVYNEEEILEEFKGMKIAERLDMSKNYLYKLLLNTLQNYHRNGSVEQRLFNLLDRALILYNKMLYKSCLEVLQKARKLSIQYEYYEIQLKVIQMIMRVAIEEKKDDRFMAQFYPEQQLAIEHIQRINEYHHLYNELYSFFSKKGNDLRVKGMRKQYQNFLQHPLLSGEKKPGSYEEKSYYYLTFGLCHFCLGNAGISYESTQKRLNLVKSRPEKLKEDPDTYITILNSVIFYGSVLRKIKECEKAFDKLNEFLNLFPEKKHKLFVAFDNMMALYITAGSFRDGLVYADKAKEEIRQFETKIFASNKVSLYHDMFYIYFVCKRFDEARIWLNKLLNETATGVREDIQVTARLTNLILHFELGNTDLMPYLFRRTYSFLRKQKRLNKLEKALLEFISRLLHADPLGKKEIIGLFAEMKKTLEKLTKDSDEAMVLTEYFDYISWLESKISGRAFEKIVKEKRSKR